MTAAGSDPVWFPYLLQARAVSLSGVFNLIPAVGQKNRKVVAARFPSEKVCVAKQEQYGQPAGDAEQQHA